VGSLILEVRGMIGAAKWLLKPPRRTLSLTSCVLTGPGDTADFPAGSRCVSHKLDMCGAGICRNLDDRVRRGAAVASYGSIEIASAGTRTNARFEKGDIDLYPLPYGPTDTLLY
jgi:hypothetical protein